MIDLAGAEFVDHHALLVLAQSANGSGPLRIRGTGHLRKLGSLVGVGEPGLRFEDDGQDGA